MKSKGVLIWVLICLFGFSACGGGRHVSESLNNPPDLGISLKDNNAEITLNYVIVPNGQGAWTEDADWDEYVLTIKNISDKAMGIGDSQLIDSKGLYVKTGFLKHEKSDHRIWKTTDIPIVGTAIAFTHLNQTNRKANAWNKCFERQIFHGLFSSNSTISGSVFFPVTPNPKALIIEYGGEGIRGKLEIPLEKINGLHERARK